MSAYKPDISMNIIHKTIIYAYDTIGIEINLVKNPKTLQKEETQISIKKI